MINGVDFKGLPYSDWYFTLEMVKGENDQIRAAHALGIKQLKAEQISGVSKLTLVTIYADLGNNC